MARKNDSPQKAAMREMMRDYLKNNDIGIKNETDVNSVMRNMMSVPLEGVQKNPCIMQVRAEPIKTGSALK